MLILVISLLCLILVFAEMKPLYPQDKRVFWVYAGFLAAGFVLWILVGLDVEVPSPAGPIKNAVTAIFGIR